ncbi:MAG: EamA family transporter [Amaricoccus sp.]
MPASVFLVVLLGALLHAGWNAIVKSGRDKVLTTTLVAAGSGLIALPLLPFVAQPAPESWPLLGASTVLQVVYFLLVANAYRLADLSQAYPLMRGTAPVLVALAGLLFLGERLAPWAWLGIGCVSAGILALALGSRGGSRAGVMIALGNAVVIAGYTLIDGHGARLSGTPIGYALWLFLLNAVPLVGWALATRARPFLRYARAHPGAALTGGFGNLGSYGLALWAMTQAPVAVVAALRETSVLFGLAIAALVLGERVTPGRAASAGLIALGAISLRLA